MSGASGLARNQVISVDAHGSSQPRDPSDPYSAENRRLAILVLKQPLPAASGEETNEGAATPAPEEPATPATPAAAPTTPAAAPTTTTAAAPVPGTPRGAAPTGPAAPATTSR